MESYFFCFSLFFALFFFLSATPSSIVFPGLLLWFRFVASLLWVVKASQKSSESEHGRRGVYIILYYRTTYFDHLFPSQWGDCSWTLFREYFNHYWWLWLWRWVRRGRFWILEELMTCFLSSAKFMTYVFLFRCSNENQIFFERAISLPPQYSSFPDRQLHMWRWGEEY